MSGSEGSSLRISLDLRVMLRPGAQVDGDRPVVRYAGRTTALPDAPGVRAALDVLARRGSAASELRALAASPRAMSVVALALTRLRAEHVLWDMLFVDGEPLLALLSARRHFEPSNAVPPLVTGARIVLSRWCVLRREADGWLIESPLSPALVVVQADRLTAGVLALSTPRAAGEVAVPGPALALLAALGLLVDADADERDGPRALWSLPDAWLHARSRLGRAAGPVGGTFRFAGRRPPAPVLAQVRGPSLPLPRYETEAREEPPFQAVLDGRRSAEFDQPRAPLTIAALGELLDRGARIRALRLPDPAVPTDYGISLRPSPGAGGCHELELYLAVQACEGLVPGLYRYDPSEHALERRGDAAALGEDARLACGAATAPEVVVVLAARFARVMWKYEAIGYALILKDAGVLLQTLGLCAAAMGLAWRPLGAGDSDAFCRAAGTDWWEESSVAEAALGGPLSPPPPR